MAVQLPGSGFNPANESIYLRAQVKRAKRKRGFCAQSQQGQRRGRKRIEPLAMNPLRKLVTRPAKIQIIITTVVFRFESTTSATPILKYLQIFLPRRVSKEASGFKYGIFIGTRRTNERFINFISLNKKVYVHLAAGSRISSLKMQISAAETSAGKSSMEITYPCGWFPHRLLFLVIMKSMLHF